MSDVTSFKKVFGQVLMENLVNTDPVEFQKIFVVDVPMEFLVELLVQL